MKFIHYPDKDLTLLKHKIDTQIVNRLDFSFDDMMPLREIESQMRMMHEVKIKLGVFCIKYGRD